MTKPYDPADNDTYVEILSMNPANDVEAHMFRDPNGMVKSYGVMGNFSVESGRKAADKVLSFVQASSAKLTKIKSIQLSTPFPMSLVSRYQLKVEKLFYTQSTPVFYDNLREKFVLPMDYRFLRDMKAKEFLPLVNPSASGHLHIYQDKDGVEHLGILYDSLSDLREDNKESKDSPGYFKAIKEAYQDYFLSTQTGEKVIIVRFISSNDEAQFLRTRRNEPLRPGTLVSGLRMEMAIAFKFGNRCYLSEDGETFAQQDALYINKATYQKDRPTEGIEAYIKISEDPGLLILPYSDDQFRLLKGIHERLHGLNNELHAFLSSFANKEGALDSPITPERVQSLTGALKLISQQD